MRTRRRRSALPSNSLRGVLLLERKEIPGGLADLGESELDAPYLALVPQAILADQLQLLIKAGLLEGASRCRVHLRVDGGDATVHHLEVEGSRELKSPVCFVAFFGAGKRAPC